jgi:ribonuclease HI
MSKKLKIYTDGGARGNPGPAGIGIVIIQVRDGQEKITKQISRYIGEKTNNEAEYQAIITALEQAKGLKAQEIEIISDSELVIRQCQGKYKIKDPELAQLFIKIWNLQQSFKKVNFTHVLRSSNKEADRLVNEAIDKAVES